MGRGWRRGRPWGEVDASDEDGGIVRLSTEGEAHFGMGLSATHIRDAGRRDTLLLLAAIAHALLTLLGAASEKTGMDAYLKVNTSKTRTHSLFRQGAYWYGAIPTCGRTGSEL